MPMKKLYLEMEEGVRAERAANLRKIGDEIKKHIDERDAFIVIVAHNSQDGDAELHYLATMQRGDAIRILTDYLERLKSGRN